jgi:asparagine synthase (glutamine-hydrolysing)
MCGIAGIIDPSVPPQQRETALDAMCSAMIHRGPDDSGLHSSGPATLGMRRLAIFDPANGHQPWLTPDGRFTLVFNGAIYNFRELRSELEGGWVFRTHCDTEVLLAAYVRWGESCLDRLRGMYAFAVWDATDQSLFFARDPFGIKPLYYQQSGKRLAFASELNALQRASASPFEIDPASVAAYLGWFSVASPRTIYRQVQTLHPGECATFRAGQLTLRRTWSFSAIPADLPVAATREDFSRQLRERLEDSIRAHVVADVPVGAFLSGGLDSAVVAGLMTRVTGAKLRTFTIGFDESAYSEAAASAESARHFGADHHACLLTGARVAAGVEQFIGSLDQPTGDGLNTYHVSAAARAGGVTVALSGLGGDELFGGYPSFRDIPRLAQWLPWWRQVPRPLRKAFIKRLRRGDTRRRKLADFLNYAHNVGELASLQRRVFSEPRRRALLGPAVRDVMENIPPYHPECAALSADLGRIMAVEVASAWELRTYMADLLLRDSDVMSMRHSLELRVPFVDRPLVEWLWRQDPKYRFTPASPKSALAAAVSDLLPPGLMERKKQGFSLPMAIWMRHELRPFLEETFSDSSLDKSNFLDRGTVQSSWRTFLESSDTRHWSRVWSLAVLVAFINRRLPAPRLSVAQAIDLTRAPVAPRAEPSAGPKPQRPEQPLPTRRRAAAPPVRYSRPGTLVLAPEIFSASGGVQRILQLYLRALCELGSAEGRPVKLLALNDGMLDSTDVRRCTGELLADWSVCNRDKARFMQEALRLGRGCDRVLCGHVGQLPAAWASSRLRPRQKYFVVAHGIEVWRPFSLSEKFALRGAAKILCVSEYTRGEILGRAPIKPEQATVLPNGLDPSFKWDAGRPLSECPPVILAISRLSSDDRYKGIDLLIQAMPEVLKAEPQARLRIIGQGDDLPRLQSLARGLGLLGREVEMLGFVKDEALRQELSGCRLFALPSTGEGFGLVYIEAMAHGRPCLGARATAVPEIITPATGILTEPGNVASVAQGVIHGLRTGWNQALILDQSRNFSYERFKARLAQEFYSPTR